MQIFSPLSSSASGTDKEFIDSSGTLANPKLQSKVDVNLVMDIYKQLRPVTLSNRDVYGNIIQLWYTKKFSLIGAVLNPNGNLKVIRSENIINPLYPFEPANNLLQRLIAISLRRWDLVFDPVKLQIIIWPHMLAAAKNGEVGKINDYQKKLNSKTLSAAGREKNDEIVKFKESGVPFDHRDKVDQHLRGLNDHIFRMKAKLDNPKSNLSDQERSAIKNELQQSKELLRYVNNYKFNYEAYRFGVNTILKPREKANAVWEKYKLLHVGNHKHTSPALKQFQQLINQKNLADTFNSTHRQNPILGRGSSGQIGGVACGTEYIEGLFDGPEAIFEHDHVFCMPKLPDGSMPFSDLELRQILRELCIGIYVHDTIPFFSLHFNQNADLVPVIHPVYANTLVGRVISMLDYIMKGYLNGGIYQEEFIDQWEKDPNWKGKSASALQQIIAFEQYCQEHLEGEDAPYMSLNDIHGGIKAFKNPKGSNEAESNVLQQFAGFSNSFRIIAKQNSIQKEGNLFLIDSDFDVFYTINPSPRYKQALDIHLQKHGSNPLSYQSMIEAYEIMRLRIHDHMAKMPLCRPFCAMLSVINFFSGYFSTLKKHRKTPVLPGFESLDVKGCPSIFPHLPVKKTVREIPKCNLHQIVKNWIESRPGLSFEFFEFFSTGVISDVPLTVSQIEPRWTSVCVMPLQVAIHENILSFFSPTIQSTLNNKTHEWHKDIKEFSKDLSLKITGQIFEGLSALIERFKEQYELKSVWLRGPYISQYGTDFVHPFFHKIPNAFPNQSTPLSKEPIVCSNTRIKSQMSFNEVEEGKRVVGGCGMQLKTQAIQPSIKASQLVQEHWSKMISLAPESWEDLGDKAAFRLLFEDVPASVSDNYEWMESLLFLRNGETPEDIQNRIKIEQAILEEDSDEFFSLLDQTERLHPDRYERTLLHFSAQVTDPVYMESLLNRGVSYLSKDLHGYLPIHYAAMSGSLKPLLLLLKTDVEKTSVNAVSRNGSTPLIVAIQHGQYAAVKLLLAYRASLYAISEGYTPLHCALHQGEFPIIHLLLDNTKMGSSYLNEMAEEEGTPLMLACELDSADLINKMIQLGADPKAKRKDGLTALEIALKRQCVPVLKVLLKHVIPSDQIFETAAKESSLEVYRLLAEKKSPFTYSNSFHDTPLHIAIKHGNIPLANLLIQRSKDISFLDKKNVNGESAFTLACGIGLWQVVNELHKKDAIVEYEPLLKISYRPLVKKIFQKFNLSPEDLQRCLLKAAEAGNHQLIFNVLIPMGANTFTLEGVNGWRMPHYLAKSDGIDLFVPLIANSHDLLQALEQEGNKTLAYIAAENASKRIFRLLLEQIKNRGYVLENHYRDRHLLYAVIESGVLDQVQFMLDLYKEAPSLSNQILDQKKTTSAHLAAQIGSLEILKALSERGADLNAVDAENLTPLDYSVRLQAKEIVAFLLEQKVNPTATTFELAAFHSNSEILHLLLQQPGWQKLVDIALARAVRRHQTQTFVPLLKCGAPLEYVTNKGWTALWKY